MEEHPKNDSRTHIYNYLCPVLSITMVRYKNNLKYNSNEYEKIPFIHLFKERSCISFKGILKVNL